MMKPEVSTEVLITLATVRGHTIEGKYCTRCALGLNQMFMQPDRDCSGMPVCLAQDGTDKVKKTVYVYVAGPLTTGQLTRNVRDAAGYASVLFNQGYAVYLPHTNVLWEIAHPATYEDWMQHDLLWVARCNCVFRFPGESPGADREVEYATGLGIPVFYDLDNLYAAWPVGV